MGRFGGIGGCVLEILDARSYRANLPDRLMQRVRVLERRDSRSCRNIAEVQRDRARSMGRPVHSPPMAVDGRARTGGRLVQMAGRYTRLR